MRLEYLLCWEIIKKELASTITSATAIALLPHELPLFLIPQVLAAIMVNRITLNIFETARVGTATESVPQVSLSEMFPGSEGTIDSSEAEFKGTRSQLEQSESVKEGSSASCTVL